MPIPARPVIGGTNRNGGPVTEYDLSDWDKLYGSQGNVNNPSDQGNPVQMFGDANAQGGETAARNKG